MTDTNEKNLISLSESDFDSPIYRIYPLEKFEAMLASNQDALVNPTKWEDPFENFFLERTEVLDSVSGVPIPLKNLAQDWYGQCWSFNQDTDAMWRIYSPDSQAKVGVKVATTPRRLFQNLKLVGSAAPYLQFFIGKISYLMEQQITKLMQGLTFSDVALGGQGDKFAHLLCIKREAFQHENEVRLIFQDIENSGSKRGANGVFKYRLDPNVLFDEVVLDPRLKDADVATIVSKLKAANCKLQIAQSPLYQAPRFVIPFQ